MDFLTAAEIRIDDVGKHVNFKAAGTNEMGEFIGLFHRRKCLRLRILLNMNLVVFMTNNNE